MRWRMWSRGGERGGGASVLEGRRVAVCRPATLFTRPKETCKAIAVFGQVGILFYSTSHCHELTNLTSFRKVTCLIGYMFAFTWISANKISRVCSIKKIVVFKALECRLNDVSVMSYQYVGV